ncbi:MAG: hypothetical protein ACRDVK_02230 [Acidimicrobiia bacterium]
MTEAGEKAKLVAVMVTVALGGAMVAVVATAVVVVVTVVVVTALVVVVVGARVVVVVGTVVGVGWVLVAVAEVVGAVVVRADAVVDVGGGTVVTEVVNDTSRESFVTPLAQAVRNAARTNSKRRRIAGHTYEAWRRVLARMDKGDARRPPGSGAFSPRTSRGQLPLPLP